MSIQLRLLLLGILFPLLSACGGGRNSSEAPIARITTTFPKCGETMSFDGSGSTDANGDIASYDWDFGDGTSASGINVTHLYTAVGDYTVKLTVSDDTSDDSSTEIVNITNAGNDGNYICGTITVPDNYVIDGDVNDPAMPFTSNDVTPQALPVPVTLFGYLNTAGNGPDGRSKATGDSVDRYVIEAIGGEVVEFKWRNNPGNGDFAYVLAYASDNGGMNFPRNCLGGGACAFINQSETFTLTQPGTYTLTFTVSSTTANAYQLNISHPDITIARQDPEIKLSQPLKPVQRQFAVTDDFIPGEIIVALNDKNDVSEAINLGMFDNLPIVRSNSDGLMLLRMSVPEKPGQLTSVTRQKQQTIATIKALSNNSAIRFAEPNFLRKIAQIPNDNFYSFQSWYMDRIKAPAAWDITTGSDSVNVAVLDTGAIFTHPELDDRWDSVNAYDFVSTSSATGSGLEGGSNDNNGLDSNATDPGYSTGCPASDVKPFHGVLVAGVIGAETNDGIGTAGLTWQGKILPLRVIGDCGILKGGVFDSVDAIRYAAGLSNSTGIIIDAVDVINMSYASPTFSQAEQDAVNAARTAGVILVAAAGNESSDSPRYPAAYDGVISVSAINQFDALSSFSNFGSSVDITAPGGTTLSGGSPEDVIVTTLWPLPDSNLTGGAAGTSFAAPQVSGVIALMKAVYPEMTPDEVDGLLESGDMTNDLGEPGRDDSFGWGVLDAEKAVIAARNLKFTDRIQAGNSGKQTMTLFSVGEASPPIEVVWESNEAGVYKYNIAIPGFQIDRIESASNLNNDLASSNGEIKGGVNNAGINIISGENIDSVDFDVASTIW